MKVTITAEMKKIITTYDMPSVNKVIKVVKEDETTVNEWAEMAARVAANSNNVEVLKSSAEIVKNCRVWDCYDEGSADFDVWIRFVAYTDNGFIMGAAYLTDIWSITGENGDEIRTHMHIRKFVEVEH